MSAVRHDPRHRFDCGRCKFSWCCGPLCACALNEIPLSSVPEERLVEVAAMRRDAGYAGAADELMRDWEADRLRLASEVMES